MSREGADNPGSCAACLFADVMCPDGKTLPLPPREAIATAFAVGFGHGATPSPLCAEHARDFIQTAEGLAKKAGDHVDALAGAKPSGAPS